MHFMNNGKKLKIMQKNRPTGERRKKNGVDKFFITFVSLSLFSYCLLLCKWWLLHGLRLHFEFYECQSQSFATPAECAFSHACWLRLVAESGREYIGRLAPAHGEWNEHVAHWDAHVCER